MIFSEKVKETGQEKIVFYGEIDETDTMQFSPKTEPILRQIQKDNLHNSSAIFIILIMETRVKISNKLIQTGILHFDDTKFTYRTFIIPQHIVPFNLIRRKIYFLCLSLMAGAS